MVQGPPGNERESSTQIKSSSAYGVPHGRMGWSSPWPFQSSKKIHCTAKDSMAEVVNHRPRITYYLAVQGRRKSRDKPLNISNGDKKIQIRPYVIQRSRSGGALNGLSGITFSLSVGHVSTVLSSIVIHQISTRVLFCLLNLMLLSLFYIIYFVQYINGYTTTCSLHQILQNYPYLRKRPLASFHCYSISRELNWVMELFSWKSFFFFFFLFKNIILGGRSPLERL